MARSLSDARRIIEAVGCSDPVAWGADVPYAEDRLGCSLGEHRVWLRTESADGLRCWAEDWMRSGEDSD
jgi:hypothetical protein